MHSCDHSKRSAAVRLAALAGAAALAPFSLAVRAASVPPSLRIGYQKGSATLVLAKRRGNIEARLKKLGIDKVEWVEFQFGPPMLEAIGAGAVDIGAVGDTPPIFAQAGGANLVYAAATPSTEHAILVTKDSPIRNLPDLRGKRVAFGKGSSAHNAVLRALAIGGLGYSDIQPAYLAPADASAAFVGGNIDAWAVWDPFYAVAEHAYQARVLVDSTREPRLASHSFYIAHRTFADKYPETLSAVLDEIGALVRYSADHRDEVAALAAQVTGIDVAVQQYAYRRAKLQFGPVTEQVLAQQQQIADTFYQQKLIPKPIHVRDIWWRAPAG